MSQVIIRRKANQEIPEDFLKLALAQCPKTWGIALIDGGKLETKRGTDIDLDLIRATEKDFNDVPFTLFLSSADKATNLNDISPYDLVGNDDDEPLLTVFIDGEFPGYNREKSSSSSAYFLAQECANIAELIFDAVDKDLGKLMVKLGEKNFSEKIKMNAVSHGYITFVAQNGGMVSIGQGDTHKEFPWGWVSNTFGFGETKEPPKEEPTKKKGLFAKRSTVREPVNHQPSNNVIEAGADKVPPKETAVQAPPPTQNKPIPLTLTNIIVKEMAIPAHLPRKLAKRWIKERIGHVPPNYQENGAKFKIYFGPDGKHLTLSEVQRALGHSAMGLPKLENPKSQSQKDVEPKNIDSSKLVSSPLPIISPSARERFQRFISDTRIKKIIGENSGLITDPDNVQGYEGKIVPLNEQLQMKDMKDVDALPFVEFEAIGRSDIHMLAVMCWHYKVRALKAELALSKAKPKKTEAQHVEEHTLAKEELAPETKKKGLFARRAVA